MPTQGRGSRLPWLALFLLLLPHWAPAAAQRASKSSPWQTLSGDAPSVIARGGLSGLFPDSSVYAYTVAQSISLPNALMWCDVQLTRDGIGICLPDVKMDDCTNIADIYPNGRKDYVLNGAPVSGWFSLDYNIDDLSEVFLKQYIYTRTDKFDLFDRVAAVNEVEFQLKKPHFWLNIQHDMFFSQHNLSMGSYLLSVSRHILIDFVSSPEISFLSSVAMMFKGTKTQLIFRSLGADIAEPSTNQTYGSLLKNMTFVKTFASGILIPKSYIWPVNADNYLLPYTSIVLDAHKAGLKVFAANFSNDNIIAYNYSYDPIAEYLSFVDNGDFSVDGVLSDFSISASAAIGCFSHTNKTISGPGNLSVISHNGASGVYPACTDLAYKQAVDDGADYIDCPVQVTKDGVLICFNSTDLTFGTTAAKSSFNIRSSVIPEIQSDAGIFTINLTWQEIQKNLKPEISNPQLKYGVIRNPLYTNAGNFVTLKDFLAFAKDKALSGVLIGIEHAAILAEKLGFSVTDAVLKDLDDSGYSNQTRLEVIIQSSDSSVLIKLRQQTEYKLMYVIHEPIGDAVSSSIKDITGFAHSVAINKESIYPKSEAFIIGKTDLVTKFQSAKLSVFAYLFMNEFVSQPWDFYSDATMEINTYFQQAGVNGIITDFPGTAVAYRRNTCLNLGDKTPRYMLPVEPAGLLDVMSPLVLPPALPPMPTLTDADVVEPPVSPASLNMSSSPGKTGSPAPLPPSGQPCNSASVCACLIIIVGSFLLIW